MAIKNALIVDDSKSARAVLKRMLNGLKLEVDTVESASDAIDYLESHTPDIIFMDHMMPGMDGFEAVKKIKSNTKTAIIPIMMYTSRGGDVYLSQAKALGAVGVIPKTISPVGLKEALFKLGLVKDRRVASSGKLEAGRVDRRKPKDSAIDEKLAKIKAETRHLQGEFSSPLETSPDLSPGTSPERSTESSAVNAPENQQLKEALLKKQIEHDTYIEDLKKLMDEQTIELHKSMWLGIETVSHEIFSRLNSELDERLKQMEAVESERSGLSESITGRRTSWPLLIVVTVLLASIVLNVTLLSRSHTHDNTVASSGNTTSSNTTDVEIQGQTVAGYTDHDSVNDLNVVNILRTNDNKTQADIEAFVLWAHNREIEYPFDELALNGNRLPSIEELVQKAVDANYTGSIILQTHVGRFCLNRDEKGDYELAEDDLPVAKCEYIGNYMQPNDVASTHQSMTFANYLSDLSSLSERGIEVDVSNVVRSVELSNYPKQTPKTTAAQWNKAAKMNNRITVKLEPFSIESLADTE